MVKWWSPWKRIRRSRSVWVVWSHECAVSRRWRRELSRFFRRLVVPRLFPIAIALVGAIVLGHAIDGPVGSLVGVAMFIAVLALWLRVTAAAIIHDEQQMELQALRRQVAPKPATQPRGGMLAMFRAIRDHDDRKQGDFYHVPFSDLDEEVHGGRGEQVTQDSSLLYLLDSIETAADLIEQFPNVPPQHGEYYPHSPKLRKLWPVALAEMGKCIDVATTEGRSVPNDARHAKTWIGDLKRETDGEGRLDLYQDRARRLREWAAETRLRGGLDSA